MLQKAAARTKTEIDLNTLTFTLLYAISFISLLLPSLPEAGED